MDRRGFLRLAAASAAGVASLSLPRPARAQAGDTDGPFRHGVASGDPLSDRVVLWTRVSGQVGPAPVRWLVASDPDLTDVVASGVTRTDESVDHTVHVDAAGLRPGTTYWYAFEVAGTRSPLGRTRTAATGRLDRLRFAFLSCSDFQFGFYNAYARVADRHDLDLVVHLGDYIYEAGVIIPGDPLGREPDPPHETVTLADYRRRHAQQHTDGDLQRAHATHPWIVVWDDHEIANDAWRDGAEGHDPRTQGPWEARKAAAIRAWREWMPVRWPDPDDPVRVWRSFRFGDLVDLAMLDTRLHGRDEQPSSTGPTGADSNDPDRELLGPVQRAWLQERLATSTAAWRVIGNQVMLAPHTFAGALPTLPEEDARRLGLRQGGNAEGSDNWNAYTAERDRLLGFLREHRIDDVVVISGDIHSSWGADLVENPYDVEAYDPVTGEGSVGVELVTTSVTAVNFGDLLMGPTIAGANAAVLCENPNVKHVDLGGHGYVVVDIDRERARAEWWHVESVRRRVDGETLTAVAEAPAGANQLHRVDLPAPLPLCTPAGAGGAGAPDGDGDGGGGGAPGGSGGGATGDDGTLPATGGGPGGTETLTVAATAAAALWARARIRRDG